MIAENGRFPAKTGALESLGLSSAFHSPIALISSDLLSFCSAGITGKWVSVTTKYPQDGNFSRSSYLG